jgi:hypothetical protein
MLLSHTLGMGLQWIHSMRALAPMTRLSEMIMVQIITFIHGSEMRRRVMAKEVLLHTAARMDRVPAILAIKGMLWSFADSISHRCLPNPRLTDIEVKADAPARAS